MEAITILSVLNRPEEITCKTLKTPNKVTENMFQTKYEQEGLRLILKLSRTPVSDYTGKTGIRAKNSQRSFTLADRISKAWIYSQSITKVSDFGFLGVLKNSLHSKC